jgi:hypothetical protein
VLNVADPLDFRGYSVYGDIMQPQLLHTTTAKCGGPSSSTLTSSAASQTSQAPTATESSATNGDVAVTSTSSTSSASNTAAQRSSSTVSTSVPAAFEQEATSSVGNELPTQGSMSPAPRTAAKPLAAGQNQTDPTPAPAQDSVDCHECEERTIWLSVGLGAATLLALVFGALFASLLQRQRRALAARGAVSPGSVSPPLSGGAKGKDADESFPGSFANPLFYDGPVMGDTRGGLRDARPTPIYVPPPSVSSEAIDYGETEA